MAIRVTIRSLSLYNAKKRPPSLASMGLLHSKECRLGNVTFQCFMMSIFSNMVVDTIEVFMDDFSVVADSFYRYLSNLVEVLKDERFLNFMLSWEKCHLW